MPLMALGVAAGAGTRASVEMALVWGLLTAAALAGSLMIAVGMIEELPGIIRDVWSRHVK